jgi:hypothetical protein
VYGKVKVFAKADRASVIFLINSLSLLEPIVIILSESEVERIVDISFDLTNYSEMRK